MDIEAFYGVRVLRNENVLEVAEARKKLEYDETGKAIHDARTEIQSVRTAEDRRAPMENQERLKRVRIVQAECYEESTTLTASAVPTKEAAMSSSEFGGPENCDDKVDDWEFLFL